jgi:DNA-binding NtrC family response regulator
LLDEIGELPEAVQAKLLRALALGELRPVGSARATQVEVRVIGATHRDLKGQVAAGTFRDDLYARLAGWVIRVPSLRERRDDILELARGVLERQRGEAHTLSCRAAEALLLHDWPFNVRELEHALVSALVNAEDGVIRCHCLPADIGSRVLERDGPQVRNARGHELAVTPGAVPADHELRRLLVIHRGNVLHVARALGKDRQQVYRWIKRYGIDLDAIREGRRDP